MTPSDALLLLAGYLAGSLPMGLLIGRARGVDVRLHGSCNIGATNVGRVLGKPWFLVVFALDFGKAYGPVWVARRFASAAGTPERDTFALMVGVAAILGHVFPLYLKFKGGKGVAAAAGVFVAVAPAPTGVAALAWLAVFLASRYVSLASLAAAAALPLACFLLPSYTDCEVASSVQWMALVVGLLIIVRHRSNIGRLLRGEESRAGRRKA